MTRIYHDSLRAPRIVRSDAAPSDLQFLTDDNLAEIGAQQASEAS